PPRRRATTRPETAAIASDRRGSSRPARQASGRDRGRRWRRHRRSRSPPLPDDPWARPGKGFRSGCSLAHDIGKQAEKPRPLDRPRQLALLLRRHRGDAARHDLAALGDEALQQPDVLVVDLRRVGSGERAGFAAPEEGPAGNRRRAPARCALAFHLRLHLFPWRTLVGRPLAAALRWRLATAVARLVAVSAAVSVPFAVPPSPAAPASPHYRRVRCVALI